MLNSKNSKLIGVANSMIILKGATENGFVLPRIIRIESLTRLSKTFSKFGIKSKVCISDNHDLEGSGLKLCGKFKHHNFKD
ncbi:hypothetical protein HXX01_02120 [Candidatus Nomurabacteria bacterium]|nr:hypothetical protein [Candidatus Nomurabacteria bacterium]